MTIKFNMLMSHICTMHVWDKLMGLACVESLYGAILHSQSLHVWWLCQMFASSVRTGTHTLMPRMIQPICQPVIRHPMKKRISTSPEIRRDEHLFQINIIKGILSYKLNWTLNFDNQRPLSEWVNEWIRQYNLFSFHFVIYTLIFVFSKLISRFIVAFC